MYDVSGDENEPSPFYSPPGQGRQEVHAQNVQIVVFGDLQPDITPNDAANLQLLSPAARYADKAVTRPNNLVGPRRNIDKPDGETWLGFVVGETRCHSRRTPQNLRRKLDRCFALVSTA